jgi:phosphoglycerate dehydrogenase-like enzyme
MKRLLIATIPGMIEKADTIKLSEICEIDWLIRDHIDETELAQIAKDYDYLMLNYDIVENLTNAFYDIVKDGKLEVVSADITGMSWAQPVLAKEAGIKLLNTTNYCTESVAEYTITQILLYAECFHLTYKDKAEGKNPEARKTINILNKTLGVVGLGNIGVRVAEIAKGMGFKVIAWNRTKKEIDGIRMVELEDLFRESDFITLHLKTIPEKTVGIIDKKMLELCKPNCFIENQADGKLVNMDDLRSALESNKIAGYGATGNDENADLEKYENVILSPANAWNSDESMANLKEIWMNNIVEYDRGNIVNLVEE